MDDLLVSVNEHRILYKYKSNLESQYNVKLNMPEIKTSDSCNSRDVIFVSIYGDEQNINNVKKFLRKKMEATRICEDNNASVIILNSDSEDELDAKTPASKNKIKVPKRKKVKTEVSVIDLATSPVPAKHEMNLCDVSSSTIDLNDSIGSEQTRASTGRNLPDFIPLIGNQSIFTHENFIPFISTEDQHIPMSNVVSNEDQRIPMSNVVSNEDDDIIVLSSDEEEIPRPIAPAPKLRPIVIDGSNVARLHGKPTNTYSCKGIKISVEFFLNRGHTEVTAFVPMFRRHCKRGPILTTDQNILEKLANTQHVVFTPSRRVEGKSYACYDDRFIVELAASKGGVILSNDNFKDLLDVSPEFKETINKRLLMFCFVGDKLMIPDDPLGAGGPRLPEFLTFPPT